MASLNIFQQLPIFSWIKSKFISMACLAVLWLLFQSTFPLSLTNFYSHGTSTYFLDHTLPLHSLLFLIKCPVSFLLSKLLSSFTMALMSSPHFPDYFSGEWTHHSLLSDSAICWCLHSEPNKRSGDFYEHIYFLKNNKGALFVFASQEARRMPGMFFAFNKSFLNKRKRGEKQAWKSLLLWIHWQTRRFWFRFF